MPAPRGAVARLPLGFLIAIFLFDPLSAAEYRLRTGDILELSATSISDFRHRASVDLDGAARFPLIGSIPARDRTIDEVLQAIQERVTSRTIRRYNADGSGYDVVIDKDAIVVAVAEYNPVYIRGDVAKPGSYPYRPGLTLRQAISLAGGYDILKSRMDNPYLLSSDLRSEYESLSNQYARDQARIERMESELGKDPMPSGPPPGKDRTGDIRAIEVEQLDTRQADYEKEKLHLTEGVQSLTANLTILEKQMRTESERAKVDQDDLERVEGLVAKGMAPVTRLSETRRLVLLSASRASEIEARAEQVRQRREEEKRKLEKLTDQRRMDLLRELQDTKVRLAEISAKQTSTVEKMLYVGGIQSQVVSGEIGAPDLKLFRPTASGSSVTIVGEDTDLLPGDVVEVALRLDQRFSNGPPFALPSDPAHDPAAKRSDQPGPELRKRLSEQTGHASQ